MKNESSLGRAGGENKIFSRQELRWIIFGMFCLALLGMAILGGLLTIAALVNLTKPDAHYVTDWDKTWGTAVIFVAAGLALGLTFHGLPFQFVRYGDDVRINEIDQIEETIEEWEE